MSVLCALPTEVSTTDFNHYTAMTLETSSIFWTLLKAEIDLFSSLNLKRLNFTQSSEYFPENIFFTKLLRGNYFEGSKAG
jgi:hypothetical protein